MDQPENPQELHQTLLDFFRVMSDPNRLEIAGLLAGGEATVVDLARMLNLRQPDVVRHLARLEALGLLCVATGESTTYRLDVEALIRLKKDVFASVSGRAPSKAGLNAEQKTLATFVVDGRLIGIPAQHQRRVTVTRWLAGHFQPGERYGEKEVNEIIQRVHHDSSSLRRYMVDYGFMQRDHGVYWRAPEDRAPHRRV